MPPSPSANIAEVSAIYPVLGAKMTSITRIIDSSMVNTANEIAATPRLISRLLYTTDIHRVFQYTGPLAHLNAPCATGR